MSGRPAGPAAGGTGGGPRLPVLLPAILAPAAAGLAFLGPGPALLPILATLAAWPALARLLLAGRPRAAVLAILLWAAALSASVIVFTAGDPAGAATRIARGAAYRDEMFAFIRSGSGPEGDPARFLPQHLLHLGAFAGASALSGGLLGLLLGALLVGYMSFYVGALVAEGGAPWIAALCGWPPWAILRVVAFVILGVALSRPGLSLLARRPLPLPGAHRWYAGAAILLAADALLKWLLAPAWAGLLRRCLTG